MAEKLDFKAIHNDLLAKQTYRQWFPGTVQGSTYRAANHIRGGKKPNLWIMLKGSHPGCWGDYVDNSIHGTNLLRLYCYWAGTPGWNSSDSKAVGKAMYEAAKRLGYTDNQSFAEKSSLSAQIPVEKKDKSTNEPVLTEEDLRKKKKAQEIWNKALPLDGTIAEKYFIGREIYDIPSFDQGRFLSNYPYYFEGKVISYHPCIIFPYRRYPSPEIVAIQRLYLSEDGRKKANVASPRKNLGPVEGAAIQFPSHDKAAARNFLFVGEGVETCLSYQQVLFKETGVKFTVWVVGGGDNTSKLILPKKAIISAIVDNDDKGINSASALKENCRHQGVEFSKSKGFLIPPHGKDWNDYVVDEVKRTGEFVEMQDEAEQTLYSPNAEMHKQGNLNLSEFLKSKRDFSFLDNLTKEFGENILMEEIREVQTDKRPLHNA